MYFYAACSYWQPHKAKFCLLSIFHVVIEFKEKFKSIMGNVWGDLLES